MNNMLSPQLGAYSLVDRYHVLLHKVVRDPSSEPLVSHKPSILESGWGRHLLRLRRENWLWRWHQVLALELGFVSREKVNVWVGGDSISV